MKLVLVGLSHKTAPLTVRECLAPPPEAVGGELERCTALSGVREAFLVATCNRVEALAVLDNQADPNQVVRWLAADRGVPAAEIRAPPLRL